eukprot:COSAG06_NODE_50554_length_318_cov_0.543379_1_plen_32_part_10
MKRLHSNTAVLRSILSHQGDPEEGDIGPFIQM